MNSKNARPVEIKLHKQSRVLEIGFDDGQHFNLPCEYLRVYSPSVEVRGLGELQVYKEEVNISDIQPVGNYAVRIFFDDGHKSGVYSWETLYDLGVHYAEYWQDYLNRLKEAGYKRRERGTE